ncbi:MAG: hypothetical protein H7Y27_03775, partial [Gemmatimonadaceae bacterium]|nr:hypothetical protein [Chitinophagaceae bacterium]
YIKDGLTEESLEADSPRFQLDEKVKQLVKQRQAELSAGILESDLRTQLSELKPVADQFRSIASASRDARNLARKFISS